ncbi:DegV family protein [Companilactobacillus sp. DQM5]|uniref:DegV family protein n=1 Tax=Companilactobacillus sp. DQM5 TaxID=3463359 RepID=UPI00405A20EE
MTNIAILTDSSSYLTNDQIKQNNIEILPIPIIWDNKEYLDMVDISFDDFYKNLITKKQLPTTSTPSIGALEKKIDELKSKGFDEIIGIFISSGISSFISNAKTYAQQRKDITFRVFDSHVTCAGLANMTLLASKMVRDNHNSDEIFEALSQLRDTTNVRLIVDDLKHLNRTGRLSNAASFIGGILNIKPIIGMDVQESGNGKLSVIEKERTYIKAFKKVQQDVSNQIKNKNYKVRATIIDAHDPEKSNEWVTTFKNIFPDMEVDTSIIGPVVGVHTGQGAIAVIWSQDWKEIAESYN